MKLTILFGLVAILCMAYHHVCPYPFNQSEAAESSRRMRRATTILLGTRPAEKGSVSNDSSADIMFCGYPFCSVNSCRSFMEDCHCDVFCEEHGDCCYGYESCMNETLKDTEFIRKFANHTDCSQNIANITVNQCPSAVKGHIADSCEYTGAGNRSPYNLVPVDNRGVHYRNVYCSLCNEVPVSNVTFWNVRSCNDNGKEMSLRASTVLTSMFAEQMQISCGITPVVPDKYERALFVRSCGPKSSNVSDQYGLIDSCSWNATSSVEEGVERKCGIYEAFVYSETDEAGSLFPKIQRYKNVFCARCNGVTDSELKCLSEFTIPDRDIDDISPTVVVGSDPVNIPVCGDGNVYNKTIPACVAIKRCGINKVFWQGRCIFDPFSPGFVLPDISSPTPTLHPHELMTIEMTLVLRTPLTLFRTVEEDLLDEQTFGLMFEDALKLSFDSVPTLYNISANFSDAYVTRTQVLGGEEFRFGNNTKLTIKLYQRIQYQHLYVINRTRDALEKLRLSRRMFVMDYTVYNQDVTLPVGCPNGVLTAILYDEAIKEFIRVKGRSLNDVILRVRNGAFNLMVCDKNAVKFDNCEVKEYNMATFEETECNGTYKVKATGEYLAEPYVVLGNLVYTCKRLQKMSPAYPFMLMFFLKFVSTNRTTSNGEVVHTCSNPTCPPHGCGVSDEERCFCDAFCERNRDCCIGYGTCMKNQTTQASFIDGFKQYMDCKQNISRILVSACPSDVTGYFANACAYDTGSDNIYTNIPVVGRGVHYRNIYCSQCHGLAIENVQFWSISTSNCKLDNVQRQKGFLTINAIVTNMFVEQLQGECPIYPSTPDKYQQTMFVRSCGLNARMSTRPNKEETVIDTCNWNATSANCATNRRIVEHQCRVYSAHVHTVATRNDTGLSTFSLIQYKNMYCALCNGISYSHLVCPTSQSNYLEGTSEPYVNINGGVELVMYIPAPEISFRPECEPGETYDAMTGVCQPLLRCGISHVAWEGSCIRDPFDRGYILPNLLEGFTPGPKMVMAVQMKLELRSPLILILKTNELNDTDLALTFLSALSFSIGNVTSNVTGNLNVSVRLGEKHTRARLMPGGTELTLGRNEIIDITLYRKYAVNERDMNQTYLWKLVDRLEKLAESGRRFDMVYTVYSQGVALPLGCADGNLLAIPYNESLKRYLEESIRDVNDAVLRKSTKGDLEFVTCDTSAPKFKGCDIVTYNLTSFRYHNLSKTYTYEENGKNLSEPYVIILDQVYVCVRPDPTMTLNHWTLKVSPTLVLVGITISLIFLFLTLLLHLMLKVLRTLPGLMLMNLCAVLFIAQLLYITAMDKVSDKVACSALAMITHFFWLATFFWMNAIAANMAWTFSRGLLDVATQSRKRLKVALCYAYGVPAIVVLVCGLLDKLADVPIGYGPEEDGGGPCWFNERPGLFYAFFLPIGLILTANLCLFIATTVSITKIKQMSKVATGKASKTDFFIFIKLSLLMGFMWIFGFIGTFTNNVVVWHVFVIFNSTLGLYIFLAFFFNRRTLKLLQKTFGSGKASGMKNSMSTTVSSLRSSTSKGKDDFDKI